MAVNLCAVSGSALHTRHSWGTGLSISTVKWATEIQQLVTIFFNIKTLCRFTGWCYIEDIGCAQSHKHTLSFCSNRNQTPKCENQWNSTFLTKLWTHVDLVRAFDTTPIFKSFDKALQENVLKFKFAHGAHMLQDDQCTAQFSRFHELRSKSWEVSRFHEVWSKS